jgi:hypothetical protein
MTMTDPHVHAAPPDTRPLLAAYRDTVVPAAAQFLDNTLTAAELRDTWHHYYLEAFHPYDLTVEAAWRHATGTDGTIETGPPTADPQLTTPLAHFPVSIAHNNLDRLTEVLNAELGNTTASHTHTPERLTDYAHTINRLHTLMTSLAG